MALSIKYKKAYDQSYVPPGTNNVASSLQVNGSYPTVSDEISCANRKASVQAKVVKAVALQLPVTFRYALLHCSDIDL